MSTGFYRMGANVRGKALPRAVAPAADDAGRPSIGFRAKLDETPVAGPGAALTRVAAVQQGYTGDQCSNCFSMRMQIAGHCMVCADCGTTTGCS
jgi:hypothetical protein